MSSQSFLDQLTINLCCPTPQAIPDEQQRKIAFLRNKAVLPVALLIIPFYLLLMILESKISMQLHLSNLILIIFEVIIWFSFCRTKIELFNWLYFASTTIYIPFLVSTSCPDLVYAAYSGVFVVPLTLLQVTRNKSIFLLSNLSQLVFLNTIYKSTMEHLIIGFENKIIVPHLVSAGNFGCFVGTVALYTIDESLQKAHKEIAKARDDKFKQQKAFILSFSHELRNPLNSMLGNIQLSLLKPLIRETKGLLENANICGQVLLQLVNNILDTAKVEIGRLEVNRSPTKVKELIEDIWGVCSDLIRKKGLQGLLRVDKNLPTVINADSCRLMQMMMNLVSNAVKFTDTGSVSIHVQWVGESGTLSQIYDLEPFDEDGVFDKDEKVSLLTRRNGQTRESYILDLARRSFSTNEGQLFRANPYKGVLKISVNDTGCGMNQEAVGKLFKMFGQVHEDDSKRKIGTGLGLFITKELCERMGGDIKVYSKPGEGTAFVLDIPMGEADSGLGSLVM